MRLPCFNLVLMAIQAWFGSIVVATNFVPQTITVHMLLAYAKMPGLVQTSHLIFATILFGILTMGVIRGKSMAKVNA
jgi:hypothetical protein